MEKKSKKEQDQIQKLISKPLEQISQLQAYSYNYKRNEFKEQNFPEGQQIGFMAQQIETIVPFAVQEDENGMKYVNYAVLAPILVEAIKELKVKLESQEKEIQELRLLIQGKK